MVGNINNLYIYYIKGTFQNNEETINILFNFVKQIRPAALFLFATINLNISIIYSLQVGFESQMQRRDITQTYMNACDLYIEYIKMQAVGYFYIAWKRGKKLAQTLKYQSEGKTTHIKETLTLNVSLQNKNGRAVQKNTLLYILDADGHQIDQITLPIHKWHSQFSPIDLPLAKGVLHAKVRRKQMMLIKNQMQVNSDIEDDLESEDVDVKIMMGDNISRNRNFLDSYKDEMNRVRKQLEDTLYFNNKLKNDRTVLMSRNLQVQGQLTLLKKTLKHQVQQMEKHFESKIQARENIYQDQINKMILQYNQNYEANITIITNLLKQNSDQHDLLQLLSTDQQKLKKEGEEKDKTITQLQKENNSLSEQLEQTKKDLQNMTTANDNNILSIQELNQIIFTLSQQKEERGKIIQQLSNDFMNIKAENDEKNQNLYDANRELEQLRKQIQKMNQIVQSLKADAENNKYELEFTEQTWRNQKFENQQKEEVYRNHIKQIEQQIADLKKNPKLSEENLSKIQKTQKNNKLLEEENQNLISQIQMLREQIEQLGKSLDEDLDVIQKLKKQIKDLGHTPVVDAPSRSSLNKSRLSKLSGMEKAEGSKHASRIRLNITDEEGGIDALNFTTEDLHQEIKRLNEEINQLKREIQQLRKSKEQLQNMKPKVLKPQQQQQLLKKMQQLQAKLSEYEHNQKLMNQNQSHIRKSSVQKSHSESQFIDPFDKIKQLQEELTNAQKEKQQIQHKYDYLTVQMAAKMKKIQKAQKVTGVQIVEYCDSEDQENKALIQQFQQALHRSSDKRGESSQAIPGQIQQIQRLEHAQSQHEQVQEMPQKYKVKRFNSIQVEASQISRKSKQKGRIQTIEEVASSAGGFEQETKKIKVQESRKGLGNSRQTGHRTGIETSAKVSGANSRAGSRANSTKDQHITAIKYQIPSQEERQPQKSNENQVHGEQKSQGQRSRQGSVNKSSRSRQSYISGNTLYKFQKVTHRQKIKRLEEDIQLLKSDNEKMQRIEQDLRQQLKYYRQKIQGYENQIKSIAEDKNSLQHSLHFELNKIHEDQLKKKNQVSIHPQVYNVEASLHHQDLSIVKDKYEKLLPQYETLKKQYEDFQVKVQFSENDTSRKIKQLEGYVSALIVKIQDLEKKNQHLLKKYEEKDTQHEKMKKQFQAKQRDYKENYQDLKLQKSQVEFELGTSQSDCKRFKTRIEELQDKVKKNDVMDILRQAQFEAETANKKIVQFNRLVYQLKLEKDTIEDESKLLRKKIADLNKKISEKQDNIERLQKNADDSKRKQNRLKRDIEDKQDNIEKLRDQIKRQTDQISTLKTYSSQYTFQKKKMMDEVGVIQNALQRKQYQLLSMRKEMQRMRLTIQQKDEERIQRKNALRKQIEKLEQMMVEKDKQIIELQSTIKQLNNKLDILTNQNKRTMTQKSNTYSEKLKLYIDEITQVRKVLEDNNYEINSLKQNLNETIEELESTKSSANRLEQRLAQQVENSQNLHEALENQRLDNENTKGKINGLEYELQGVRNSLRVLKTDYDREKKQHQIKKDIIEQLTKNNEENISQINRFKVKLSDVQTENQITKNLSQKLTITDQQLQNTMKQLRQLKLSYDEYKAKYIHSPSELESAVRRAESKIRDQMDNAISNIRFQSESQFSAERKRFQAEIVDLLNEISRIKTQSQKKSQSISGLQLKISKLETLPIKLQELTAMYEEKNAESAKYRSYEGQNQSLRDKLTRVEQNLTTISKENAQKSEQILQLKSKNKELEQYLTDLQLQARSLAGQNNQIQNKTAQLHKNQLGLKSEIEKLLQMLKNAENEKQLALRALQQSKNEYSIKVKGLQQKLEQMGATVNQHEKVLESHYENNIQQIKNELSELYNSIQQKDQIIGTFQEEIAKLEENTAEYISENDRLKAKIKHDQDDFEAEIEKYKSKIRDSEKVHEQSIKNLQMEIEDMGKQIARLKLRNSSVRNLTGSNHGGQGDTMLSINIKRLEEKNRIKDGKIDELKQNIFVLEETIMKLKKKETQILELQQQVDRLQKLKKNLQDQLQKTKKELQNAIDKDNILYTSLKTEINQLKASKQIMRNQFEQKALKMQSMQYELQTTKQLYGQLQKQLQKRKNLFREKIEGQSQLSQQLHLKNEKILQLETLVDQYRHLLNDKEEDIQKKMQIITNYDAKLINLQASEAKLKTAFANKANTDGQHYKNQINKLTQENDRLIKINKKLKEENQKLEKSNYEAKTQISLNESSIEKINSAMDEMIGKCRGLENLKRNFHDINEISFKVLNMSLEEAFTKGHLEQKLNQKNYQINSLIQEIEQLKFLNERKFLDFDLLKKENYELQLRLDDAEFANEQVEELREICDKLELEKKNAIFREEVMRVQIENLADQAHGQMRQKIQDTIKRAYRTSMY